MKSNQSKPSTAGEECLLGPAGTHWFVTRAGDQNESTYLPQINGCVYCKRVDVTKLPNELPNDADKPKSV
jgi:hypothetical protein